MALKTMLSESGSRISESSMGRLFRPWAPRTVSSDQDSTVSTTTLHPISDTRVPSPTPTSSPLNPLGCKRVGREHSKIHHKSRKSAKTSQLRSCEVPEDTPPSPIIPGSSSAFVAHQPKSVCHAGPSDIARTWSEALCCPEVLLLGHGLLQSPAAVEQYATFLQQQQQFEQARQARKQRPKKYSCPHCRVAFSNNGQLKGHIRIHTGERPFKCDVTTCAKTFTRNEELTRHKRIHSGLRPFACPTCGKRFGRKDHLKKHSRTHTAHAHIPVPLPLSALCYNPYLYGY